MEIKISRNQARKGIQVQFDKKPPAKYAEWLLSKEFLYNRHLGYWYRKEFPGLWEEVHKAMQEEKPDNHIKTPSIDTITVDNYTLTIPEAFFVWATKIYKTTFRNQHVDKYFEGVVTKDQLKSSLEKKKLLRKGGRKTKETIRIADLIIEKYDYKSSNEKEMLEKMGWKKKERSEPKPGLAEIHSDIPIADLKAELNIGVEKEMERAADRSIASQIAYYHLKEDPKYYSKLKAAGLVEEEEILKPVKTISSNPEPQLTRNDWGTIPDNLKYSIPVKPITFSLTDPEDKKLVTFLTPFISQDYLRPVMNAVYFEPGHIVASDAYSLVHLKSPTDLSGNYCVTKHCLTKLDDSYKTDDGDKVLGDYPNWRGIIPVKAPFRKEINVLRLKTYCEIMKRSRFITDEHLFIGFTFGEKEIWFQIDRIIKICEAWLKLGHEMAMINLADSTHAMELQPVGSSDKDIEALTEHHFVLLMPVMMENKSLDYDIMYSFDDQMVHSGGVKIPVDQDITKKDVKAGVEIPEWMVRLAAKMTKSSIAIVDQRIAVNKGTATFTNLGSWFYIEQVDLPDGIYELKAGGYFKSPDPNDKLEDYPVHQPQQKDRSVNWVHYYTIPFDVFKKHTEIGKIVLSADDLRPALTSIHIQKVGDIPMFAASNAHFIYITPLQTLFTSEEAKEKLSLGEDNNLLCDFISRAEAHDVRIYQVQHEQSTHGDIKIEFGKYTFITKYTGDIDMFGVLPQEELTKELSFDKADFKRIMQKVKDAEDSRLYGQDMTAIIEGEEIHFTAGDIDERIPISITSGVNKVLPAGVWGALSISDRIEFTDENIRTLISPKLFKDKRIRIWYTEGKMIVYFPADQWSYDAKGNLLDLSSVSALEVVPEIIPEKKPEPPEPKIEEPEYTMKDFTESIIIVRDFIGWGQVDALSRLYRSKERGAAVEIVERLRKVIEEMPETRGTEGIETPDKIVYLHYFTGGSNWYVVEKDIGAEGEKEPIKQYQAYGYVILNQDEQNAEWGYVDIETLKKSNVELDFHWDPKPFSEVIKKEEPEEPESEDWLRFEFNPVNKEGKALIEALTDRGVKFPHQPPDQGINVVTVEYKDRSYSFFDNSGEFKIDRVDPPEYISVIYFTENNVQKTIARLADEIKDEIEADFGDQIEGPAIQEEIEDVELPEDLLKASYDNSFQINKEIEKLLDNKWQDPIDDWTTDEKESISKYSGYGGLDEFGEITRGSLFEYYTPDTVIEKMWGLAHKYGYDGGSICEPSIGVGSFFNRQFVPEYVYKVAYETNKYSVKIVSIIYPEVQLNFNPYNEKSQESMYFEEVFIRNNYTVRDKVGNPYSLVIGNPPYGSAQGKFLAMGEKSYTNAKNYIDYFIFRGLDLLKPGGLLIYITGAEVAAGGKPWLDQGPSKAKEAIDLKADLIDAYRLPNGVFERTDVVSDIIVMRKN
jgi:hypothetical protein